METEIRKSIMPMLNQNGEDPVKDMREQLTSDIVTKVLWILIPIIIGACVSQLSSFEHDIQLIIWGILFLIIVFGLWANNARSIRRQRDEVERNRWEKLDERFEEIDRRFDSIDRRFDLSENSDRALLRNELVKMHREWAEEKGYITLEALEYVDKIHDAYDAVNGNDTGTQLWRDMHRLPIKENMDR